MIVRLKKLLSRLWDDNNPAGVHLGAIMDEFESDIKTLSGVIREYETDFSSRIRLAKEEYGERVLALESELADYRGRLAGLEKTRGENSKKVFELEDALKNREAECSALSVRLAEEESQLNSKYVAKMQELYDRVSQKEQEMLARWEEKNRGLETKYGALETEYGTKARQFKLREKTLEDDFRARKGELIKTFDRMRFELDARDGSLSARETAVAEREGKISALEKKRQTVTEDL
jgi:hypothetical protein